jgi:hypothetical protein
MGAALCANAPLEMLRLTPQLVVFVHIIHKMWILIVALFRQKRRKHLRKAGHPFTNPFW